MSDPSHILAILWRSVYVSAIGTIIACLLALPLAYMVARRQFGGRGALIAMMQAFMGLPPVVVGLGLYLLFRPSAAFGGLGWLYSAKIMILAQVLLVIPIVFSLSIRALERAAHRLELFFQTYPRQNRLQAQILLGETRPLLMAAVLAGFGRAIGEVGAVMIVGGNIDNRTDVLTTVIVEETSKGNLAFASTLGLLLVAVALVVSLCALMFGREQNG